MRYVASKDNSFKHTGLIILALLPMALASTVPFATADAQTTVNANVCGSGGSASVSISSPITGQAFSTVPIRVAGAVNQASQLRVFVDGQYNQTVPLDSGATSFAYDQMIDAGSHTIRLEGVDICQQTTPVAEVTVSYDPHSTTVGPGVAPATPAGTGQHPVTGEPIGAGDSNGRPENILPSITASITDGIYRALVALDMAKPGEIQSLPASILRFSALSAGLTMMVFATPIVTVAGAVAGKFGMTGAAMMPGFIRRHPAATVRLLGLGILGALVALAIL